MIHQRESTSGQSDREYVIQDDSPAENGTCTRSCSIETSYLEVGQIPCNSVTKTYISISCEYGRYLKEFEELLHLGTGGFGSVYKVRHKNNNVEDAIKKITPQKYIIDDLEEVHILEKIHHPNIVKFKGAWIDYSTENDDTLYIQMSLGDMTLEQWVLKEAPCLTLPGTLYEIFSIFIFSQINDAIVYLHSKNIRHHDLKPSNVLVVGCETGVLVQLCDFGLACCGWKCHEPGLGTQRYAAPEQWYDGVCHPKSDMYSLGVVMLETMLRFTQPALGHQGINAIADVKEQNNGDQLSTVCPNITRIIGDLVVKESQMRIDSHKLVLELKNVKELICQPISLIVLVVQIIIIQINKKISSEIVS